MKGYGEYKNTEYDWLPMVPAHWKHITIRSLMQLSDTRCKNRSDLELLSVYREYGVIKKNSREDNHNKASLDISNYKYVGKNFVVMNKMKMWQGSLGISAFEGIVSPAYIVCTIRKDLNFRYLNFLLRSHLFKTFYNRISYGIRVGQWDLRYDNLKTLNLFLPPREEQDQIVRYLDAKAGKINKLIKIKQQQIALLKEKKQAIINQAVTKGLDLSAPMKDSGIAWIGQIPQGWDVIQFSRIITDITQGWSPVAGNGDRQEGQWGVLALSAINDGDFFPDAAKPIPLNITVNSDLELRKGDFLLTRSNTRALVGDVCIVDINTEKLIPSDLIYKLTTNDIENKYLLYMMKSFIGRQQIEQSAHGSSGTMPKITHRHIKSWKILLPPIEEQNKIVNYISSNISVIKDSILHLQRIISTITEYRTRLISEVVTGKVDVRHIYIADNQLTDLEEDYCIEETNNSFNILECKA